MKNLKMIYVSAFTFLALSLNVMLSSCGKDGVGIDEKELNEKELNKKVEAEKSQESEQGKEEATENNKNNRNEWRALYPNIVPFIDHSQELQRGCYQKARSIKKNCLR